MLLTKAVAQNKKPRNAIASYCRWHTNELRSSMTHNYHKILADVQRMMSLVAPVWKVQRVLQLSFLPVRTTKFMNQSRHMTQNVVHCNVDLVTVQGTRSF